MVYDYDLLVRSQLARNRVTIISGVGYFVGPHAVEVGDLGGRTRKVTAGKTVAELTEACVPFEVGVSRYRELARGQIVGDSYPTLAESYKVAALDATNKMRAVTRLSS